MYLKYEESVLVNNTYIFNIPDSVWELLLWSHGGDTVAAEAELKQWADYGCWNEDAEPCDVDHDQTYHREWNVVSKVHPHVEPKANDFPDDCDSTWFDQIEDYNYGVDLYLRCVSFYDEKQVAEMFSPYIKDHAVLVEYGEAMKGKSLIKKSGWELVEEVLLFQEWFKANKGEV